MNNKHTCSGILFFPTFWDTEENCKTIAHTCYECAWLQSKLVGIGCRRNKSSLFATLLTMILPTKYQALQKRFGADAWTIKYPRLCGSGEYRECPSIFIRRRRTKMWSASWLSHSDWTKNAFGVFRGRISRGRREGGLSNSMPLVVMQVRHQYLKP